MNQVQKQLEQACAELRTRIAGGQDCQAEEYLQAYPELADDDQLGLELVYSEYVARHENGMNPDPDQWIERFPQWRDNLTRLFAVDRVLWGDASTQAAVSMPTEVPFRRRPRQVTRPEIDGFEVLEELGRGAMGVVYRARDLSLNREVAIKMILGDDLASEEDLIRFRIEGEAAARLQHPHIVQIHDIGSVGDRPYFELEFVAGGSLKQQLDGEPVEPKQAAEIVLKLSHAMAYAHLQGIVHRDLKPGNVLLNQDGEPKITDFGLAKRLEADDSHTRTGALIGTPGYMAPEQARGESAKVGTPVDVYGLGGILYELLTGRPPFQGSSVWDTVSQVLEREPIRPSSFQPSLSRDLETICLKCLQKEPSARYASCEELAADLQRFLNDEPIKARPVGTPERVIRWARRRPAVAALSCALSLILISAVVLGIVVVVDRAAKQRQVAREVETESEVVATFLGHLENGGKFSEERLAEANAASERAIFLSNELSANAEIRKQAEANELEILREFRYRQLLRDMQDIRLSPSLDQMGDAIPGENIARYRAAFETFGLDLSEASVDEVVEFVIPRHRVAIAVGIDRWASNQESLELNEHVGGIDFEHLRAITDALDPDPFRKKVRAARDRGDRDELVELSRVDDIETLPVDSMILMSDSLYSVEEFGAALLLLRRGHWNHPDDFWINHEIAVTMSFVEPPQWQDSVGFARAAVALRPHVAGARLTLGNSLMMVGRENEAVAVLEQALRIDPNFQPSYINLAILYFRQGRAQQAIDMCERSLRMEVRRSTYSNLISFYSAIRDLDGAVEVCQRMVDSYPHRPESHFRLGVALLQVGEFDEAVESFDRCIAIDGASHEFAPRADSQRAIARELARLSREMPVDENERAELDAITSLGMGQVCFYRQQFGSGAEYYQHAIDVGLFSIPGARQTQRGNAAAMMALAGCGLGVDGDHFEADQQHRWRESALRWFSEELDDLESMADELDDAEMESLHLALKSLYNNFALDRLKPESFSPHVAMPEQARWLEFWNRVDRVADSVGYVDKVEVLVQAPG